MPKDLGFEALLVLPHFHIPRKTQKKAASRFGEAAHSGSRRRATCENVLGRNAGHRPAHATHIRIRRERLRHSAVQERARIQVPSSRWRNNRLSMRSPVQGRAAHTPVRQRKLQIRFLLRLPGMHPDQGFPPLMQSPTSTSSCCPYFLRSSRLSHFEPPRLCGPLEALLLLPPGPAGYV